MTGATAVRLVPLEEAHITRYMSLSADPVLIATMGWKPFGGDESARFLDYVGGITVPYLSTGRTVALSIVTDETDTPVGYLSLKGIRDNSPGAEVGIAIMDRLYRGRGLGTEALRQAAGYAFREMGLSVLVLTVFTDNLPAIRSYEKLGFTRAELLPNSWTLPDGAVVDMWLMELFRPGSNQGAPGETSSSSQRRPTRGAASA